MVDDAAIESLHEEAEEANVKLPRGKKNTREALIKVLEAGGGLTELIEELGVKKRKAPSKKAKKQDEDGEYADEPEDGAPAAAAAPTPKKPRKAKPAEPETPEVEHPPVGKWDMPNATDKAALKEASGSLLTLLRQRGVKVPTDDTIALGQIVPEILSNTEDGKLDVDALIESLSTRYGTEAADRKKNKNLAGDVVVPENKPLVELMREIGQQYFKQAVPQKGATFQKAGTSIRECDWAISLTDLPTAKPGDRKLQNVGKSVIDTIREFLETGSCARLEELRSAA